MFSLIQPNTHVALRLPSGVHKVFNIVPDTTISLGKFGSFSSNSILGRPYHLTFEILDQTPGAQGGIQQQASPQLRVVSASELNAEALEEEGDDGEEIESRDEPVSASEDNPTSEVTPTTTTTTPTLRNNRQTIDTPTRQTLTTHEIEALKSSTTTNSGRSIIAAIKQSHTALAEKTAFSLAKYTLRKRQKYLKRFTVLPLDVPLLAAWLLQEKDAGKMLEVREEMLGAIASWSNVHFAGAQGQEEGEASGRWLVVDDTAGLLVALLAERMGVLHEEREVDDIVLDATKDDGAEMDVAIAATTNDVPADQQPTSIDTDALPPLVADERPQPSKYHYTNPEPSRHNTITLIHSGLQPNLSTLNYFSFDANSASPTGYASPTHPLHRHLRTLTWLELLSPGTSNSCAEPEVVSAEVLATWKSSKRGTYYRKQRRWERTTAAVAETQRGGFDGLVVASSMDTASVLRAMVPLLKGGAPVVVYSANLQPLVELVDVYSGPRKTAYLSALAEGGNIDEQDFPVDPRLLLAPSLQTVRAQQWQVLPGRTHPLMTGRGGAEGYLFTATRVLPAEGNVQARGRFAKKRKLEGGEDVVVGAPEGES